MKMSLFFVLALLLGGPNAQAAFLFGYSGDVPHQLILNDGATTLSAATNLLSDSLNQGWWSPSDGNADTNDNIWAPPGIANNFFTFSLADLREPVTSAVLRVNGPYEHDGLPLTFSLFDVSTDPATLNYNEGTSQSIYDDLGSGVLYGSILVTSLNIPTDITLNAAGLAALNSAIELRSAYFSIGGTSSPSAAQIPEPGTAVLLGAALAGLGLLRKRLAG